MITKRFIAPLLLAAGLLLAGLTAPAAHAASAVTATAPRTVPFAGIFGPCNGLEDGEVRDFGGNLYVCKYVPGFGGYYWYGPVDQSCSAPAPVIAASQLGASASRDAVNCEDAPVLDR